MTLSAPVYLAYTQACVGSDRILPCKPDPGSACSNAARLEH